MPKPQEQNKNRRLHTRAKKWIPYIGNCKALDDFLFSKNGHGWLIPKFINSFLRGIGQVVFADNPISGLLILLSLSWYDSFVGLSAIVTGTTAILTSVIFGQDNVLIRSGLTSYNAVLVGTVTTSLWTPLYSEALSPKIWAFLILGSVLSVFLTSAFANMLSSFKIPLPCLTLPFNIVTLVLFTCLMPPSRVPYTDSPVSNMSNGVGGNISLKMQPPSLFLNGSTKESMNTNYDYEDLTTNDEENRLNWQTVFYGIICSMGQVYGINSLFASILMYFAVMVYSPILCFMYLVGATIASISGLLFEESSFDSIYNGVWGYNGVLSAGAVGGFFIVLTYHSFLTAIANVIFTVLIQQTLKILFASARMPVFTMPFVLSTLVFLSVNGTGDRLPRVENFSFPEVHRYEFLEKIRQRKAGGINKEQIGEEKELFELQVHSTISHNPRMDY